VAIMQWISSCFSPRSFYDERLIPQYGFLIFMDYFNQTQLA